MTEKPCIIKVSDYPVFIPIGVLDSERESPQEVKVSFWISYLLSHRTMEEDAYTHDLVDYAQLLQSIDQHRKAFRLLESYTYSLYNHLKNTFPAIISLYVQTQKTSFPHSLEKGAKVVVGYGDKIAVKVANNEI